jgi:hypothetical protein
MKETERQFTESKRLEDRSFAHTRRLFSYYVMGISVNEPMDPPCVLGYFLFMLDACVAAACPLVVAWDSHCAAVVRHNFDMLKPVVAREAYSLGASEHFEEFRGDLAEEGDVAGLALPVTRLYFGRLLHFHCYQQVQEH